MANINYEKITQSLNKIKTIDESLKTVKKNIDTELVSKGVAVSTNLKEIPSLIRSIKTDPGINLIKGTCKISTSSSTTEIKINTNLNFTPTNVFIKFEFSTQSAWIDIYNETDIKLRLGNAKICTIKQLEKTNQLISFSATSGSSSYKIEEWIAIG